SATLKSAAVRVAVGLNSLSMRLDLRPATLASRLPFNRAGGEKVRSEWSTQQLLHRPRSLEQPLQVHPGGDVHLMQHRDQVLRGDVAGRAGRHRAASQLAET